MAEERAETCPQNAAPEFAEEWIVRGWKLWAGGLKNWSAIGREVGHDRETCKKRVLQYQDSLRALYDSPDSDPRIEVLEGLQQDLEAQLRISMAAERVKVLKDGTEIRWTDYMARSMARREVTNIRKLRAGIQGVSTEKVTQVNEGNPDKPIAAYLVLTDAEDLAVTKTTSEPAPSTEEGDPHAETPEGLDILAIPPEP